MEEKKISVKQNMKNLMEQYPDLSWKNHNEKCIEAKISRLLEKRKKLARNKETTRLET